MSELIEKGKKAKRASRELARYSRAKKDEILIKAAKALIEKQDEIIAANEKDINAAKESGISGALLDRLTLGKGRIESMAKGLVDIAGLDDPVGEVLFMKKRPNGMTIGQKRVPMGVVGIIYEARPNVTADAFGLCLKSSNVALLRGGKEAIHSNMAIVKVIQSALEECDAPREILQLVEDTDRKVALEMMKLNEYLDVLIPRGGAGLIQSVVQNSTVPVIETGVGNCHIYVDESADFDMASRIVINAKTSRPGVCNAAEKLLVHSSIADEFVPRICAELEAKGVKIIADEKVRDIYPKAEKATEEDWFTEYLDYVIGMKIVGSIDEAMNHISHYGSGHSEAIITNDYSNSQRFLEEVDAAAVYVNASTRFTDGSEFGFGAEIGISTQKLHARGPMGLKELTSTKYIIFGDGQIR
ncbi:glutamate-5-semialdehyde dehydrogenase [Peptoclostridium litorale DSM 5388]|uniref:Gamma-glutamyl phosphate reductase n=1 Tax=Peptoclostridium litorale DSM 5388 TaxID=1121324 RepID=A0A069RBY0_PEPLI|nr:glutamate-5-semialdehyde dehydrogenase [Peptoclostridium litorale]KDR94546.1 gamma-glutamyl phosphate reductase ProA [Peptoclostridium litorale DSM 5388]SIO31231.1 glutamate-5-semialdehyde dehydrogenase [Peptoclostridium litorale DSM 5388]